MNSAIGYLVLVKWEKVQVFLNASKLVSENWNKKKLKLMHSKCNKDTIHQILDSYPKFWQSYCKK